MNWLNELLGDQENQKNPEGGNPVDELDSAEELAELFFRKLPEEPRPEFLKAVSEEFLGQFREKLATVEEEIAQIENAAEVAENYSSGERTSLLPDDVDEFNVEQEGQKRVENHEALLARRVILSQQIESLENRRRGKTPDEN